jgi:hypothetical protein
MFRDSENGRVVFKELECGGRKALSGEEIRSNIEFLSADYKQVVDTE